jgi:hypothetical protein
MNLGLNASRRETYPALMVLDSSKCQNPTLPNQCHGRFSHPPAVLPGECVSFGYQILTHVPAIDLHPGEGAPLMRSDASLDRKFRESR